MSDDPKQALRCATGLGLLASGLFCLTCGPLRPATAQKPDYIVGEPFEYTVPDGLDTPKSAQLELFFQEGPKCGPNAVFIILKLVGLECNYEDVLNAIPLSDQGATLQDLKLAAEKFGLKCEVRKDLTPQDIVAAPMPMILHMKNSGADKQGRVWDHFAVLVGPSSEADGAYVGVDTGNGVVAYHTKKSIARNMSGFALVVTGDSQFTYRPSTGPQIMRFVVWCTFTILSLANIFFLCNTGRGRLYRSKSNSSPA